MTFHNRIFLQISILFIFLFSFPALSFAHAYIVKSSPFENQKLPETPKKIHIEFSEEIQPSFYYLRVFDRNGKRVDLGDDQINSRDPKVFEAHLEPNLPAGIYNISWKVVSGDGHPVDGVIPFQIGTSGKYTSLIKAKTTGYIPHIDLVMIRWIQYISGSIFVGMLFYYLCIFPKGSLQSAHIEKTYRKVFIVAYVLLLISICASLPLQAVIQTNRSWLDVWSLPVLIDLIRGSTFGKVWLFQFIITLFLPSLSFGVFAKKNNPNLWIAFILGIVLLSLKAFASHAFTESNKFLAITMDALHLITASIWIGSLIAMVVLLPLRKSEEGKAFYRGIIHLFFPWGVFTVVILAATGIYGSFLYVPTVSSLFHTGYGQVLLGKIILFLIMVVFAGMNSLKARKGEGQGWRFSLWSELITGFIVLVLAVILTNLPTAIVSPGPFHKTNAVDSNTVSLNIGPNISGPNHFIVAVKDSKGKPITDIEQVSLTFTSKEMNMGDTTIIIQKPKNGQFQTQGMFLNMAGRWKVHVHVLTKSLDQIDTDFQVLVGSQ